jgi:hypothetical protein
MPMFRLNLALLFKSSRSIPPPWKKSPVVQAFRFYHVNEPKIPIDLEKDKLIKMRYRLTINALVASLAENPQYLAELKTKYIDQRMWNSFLAIYRRKMVFNPACIFNNDKVRDEFFVAFDQLIALKLQEEQNNPKSAYAQYNLDNLDNSPGSLKAHVELSLFRALSALAEVELINSINSYKMLCSLSDLRHPHEWYPYTRIMKRKIIYHGGPTNSGKTHHALERLKNADPEKGGGLYCGPLRLLALEIYERLNKQVI